MSKISKLRAKLNKRRAWYVAMTAITAVAYYESVIATDLGQKTRVYIIFAFLFGEALGLLILGSMVQNLMNDLRNQHRAASQVATIRGLWKALEAGARQRDGLPLETRLAIYAAGDEAFDMYDTYVRTNHASAWTPKRRGRLRKVMGST